MKSIESKRIVLFIIIEFILVFLVSLPLFVLNSEKGSTLVTKKITKDNSSYEA